ncbi:MAG: hypothetical protein ACRBN8_12915 [Nannocystales bacterium]
MRRFVLATAVLVSCSTRTDTPTEVQAPIAETRPAACADVAAATLNLREATPAPLEACDDGAIAVALSQTHAWVLTADTLRQGDQDISLGDVVGTDVAAGYGASAFLLDGSKGSIHRAEGGALVPLVTDVALQDARALVRVGGTLFVGTPQGVSKVSLTDGKVGTVREGLNVLDMTVDDIGALVVLQPSGLARMLPSGKDAPLSNTKLEASRIAFDLTTSELITVGSDGVVARVDYASLVPDGPGSRPVPHGEMSTFHHGGFILAGAEYWPHRGSTPAKYPEEILWGFYPHEGEVFEGSAAVATATDAALECAEKSYAALQAWIPTATDALTQATAGDKAPRFYMWVNDYSEADDPFPADMREAKLWYWARNPGVPGRIPGYFKWETVLDQKGECHWPDAAQAQAFLETAAGS